MHRAEVGAAVRAGEPLFDIIDPLTDATTTIVSRNDGVLYMRRAVRFVAAGAPLVAIAQRSCKDFLISNFEKVLIMILKSTKAPSRRRTIAPAASNDSGPVFFLASPRPRNANNSRPFCGQTWQSKAEFRSDPYRNAHRRGTLAQLDKYACLRRMVVATAAPL